MLKQYVKCALVVSLWYFDKHFENTFIHSVFGFYRSKILTWRHTAVVLENLSTPFRGKHSEKKWKHFKILPGLLPIWLDFPYISSGINFPNCAFSMFLTFYILRLLEQALKDCWNNWILNLLYYPWKLNEIWKYNLKL